MRLVSIVLTTLNSERYLARSLESCLKQTYRNLEVLIVDGGSQDRTLEIAAGHADPRLRVIHQTDNEGRLPGAINLGLAEAQGDYLTWAQDDCWYELHAVQTLADCLDAHSDVGLVYSDYWDVDEAGARLRYHSVNPPTPECLLADDVVRQSFLFRREVYQAVGPLDARHYPVHDVTWRVSAARRFRLQPLHTPLLYYTQHAASLTGRIGPWTLQRQMAAALFQEGHFTPAGYRRRLAVIDLHQAYEDYILRGDYGAFWRHALAGLGRDPRRLLDRGLLKLMLWSALPGRGRLRDGLLARWQADDHQRQQSLARRAGRPAP